MKTHTMARRGFTLVELLLSLIVTAIVGAALIRIVLGQTRFMDQQEAWRGARSVARGSVNRLLSDLRAVEATGGVFAAVAGGQDFTVRVPYAFGMICSTAPGLTVVSLLPVDSAMFAAAQGYTGFAWRNAAGAYAYVTGTTAPAVQANNLSCTNALPTGYGVQTLGAINGSPAGRTVNLAHVGTTLSTVQPNGALVGSIVFLYRRVRYQFKNSTALPGRTGLFRTPLDGGVEEELATPFANTARVNFYVLNSATAQAAVPASLGDIRGFELVLDGMSERTPQGSAAPKTVNVRTSVFFENRPD